MASEEPVRRTRNAVRTRDTILTAAQGVFSEHGYKSATVRQIAIEAGVAPNLITRYFGSKAGLFQAASTIDLGVAAAVDGPLGTLGARLAAVVLARYETGPTADPLQMLTRSAGTASGGGLGEYFADQAARPLVAALAPRYDGDERRAADRVAGVGALILGVIMSRYLLREGPLAQADQADLERWLAQALQRIIDDPSTPPLHGTGGWDSTSNA